MHAAPSHARGPVSDRLLLGILALATSMLVLAEGDQLPSIALPPNNESAWENEILENAEGWRVPVETEEQWRAAPPPRQTDKWTLGYDSVYEESRQRAQTPSEITDNFGPREPRPSTIFRIDF